MTSAHCNFTSQDGTFYTCNVTSLNITEPETVVNEFRADPFRISHLVMDSRNIEYFPRGLPKLLPNLKFIQLTNCRLRKIERDDLAGFTSLKTLNLDNNSLEHLPDSLFEHVPQLETFSCKNNSLKLKLLEPLKNHRIVDVSENRHIKNIKTF
jgi:Leucine-rich repeat (LRR) protein